VYSIAAAQKKNPHARPVPVPAVKPITDDAVLSAVLDTVIDGHLSQYTIAKLHKAGIKVNGLGCRRSVRRRRRSSVRRSRAPARLSATR
jgi:hypothetical protein